MRDVLAHSAASTDAHENYAQHALDDKLNQRIIDEFRAHAGAVPSLDAKSPMLLLLHRGARSGVEWVHPLRYLPAGDRYVIFGLNGAHRPLRPGSATSRCTRTPASKSATIPSPSPLSSSPAPSGTGPGASRSTVHRNAVKPPNMPDESFR